MFSDNDAGGAGAGRGSDHDPSPPVAGGPGAGEPGSAGGAFGTDTAGPDDAGAGDAARTEAAGTSATDAEAADADATGADAAGQAPEPDRLTACLAERDEYLDSLRRLQAEFENYKKRMTRQQGEQMARGAMALLEKFLPVLDTLDLAIEHMGDPGSVDGRALEAVSSQLRDVLTKEGLERISPIGEHFDPTAHEAVAHLPAEPPEADEGGEGAGPDAGPDGTGHRAADGEPVVAKVMRAGYRWRGTVVRPAMVMVRG